MNSASVRPVASEGPRWSVAGADDQSWPECDSRFRRGESAGDAVTDPAEDAGDHRLHKQVIGGAVTDRRVGLWSRSRRVRC